MDRETLITLMDSLTKQGGGTIQRPVRPSRRPEDMARRGGGFTVTFYDLAQVNTGTAEIPVWDDHPILFTPAYTAEFPASAPTYGVTYNFSENFGPTQYQAYLDMLFEIPVTEWSTMYRKTKFYGPDEVQGNDCFLQEWMGTTTAMSKPYIPIPRATILPTPTFTNIFDSDATTKNTLGFGWTRRGLEYASGGQLNLKSTAYETQGWFEAPAVNDYVSVLPAHYYKITSEYDFDAPEITINIFSGAIDVYRIPSIHFWHVHAWDMTDFNGEIYTLGMQWQVLPRKMFPKLVELDWTDDDGIYTPPFSTIDPNGRKADFLEYQKTRSGRRNATMQITSPEGVWPQTGTDTVTDGSTFPITYYQTSTGTSIPALLGTGSFPHVGAPSLDFTGVGGIVTSPDHYLMGVFKMQGTFYYVWLDLAAATVITDYNPLCTLIMSP